MGSIIITRSLRQPKLEEGVHDAVIESVVTEDGVQTKFGIRDQIVVTFDIEGLSVKRRYTKSLDSRSAFYAVVGELEGDVPHRYDATDLEGRECRVTIVHRTTDAGDVWENVERVMKPNRPITLG